MRVLIACEESGEVRDRFAAKGHYALSCDLQPSRTEGNHYQGNVFDIINDGWDLMIAFPPCTHLAVSGAAWFEEKRKDGRQKEGIDFFMEFTKTNITKVCIENPVGIMSSIYRKPDQIIQPYYFGDEFQKTTCLWLKNLPKLFHARTKDMFNDTITHVDKGEMVTFKSGKKMAKWYAMLRVDSARAGIRSKTFPGVAKIMADTWG